MNTTRKIILDLANGFLKDESYHRGFIQIEWIERVSNELNLKNLSNLELANMWDMVYLTLENEYNYYDRNKEKEKAYQYLDVKSAFIEVVNMEARKREK